MKAWSMWRQLSASQRRTVLLATMLLPVFGVLLHRAAFVAQVSRMRPSRGGAPGPLEEAIAASRAVDLVAGRLGARCLSRSLVLHWILARRGFAPVLRIGVRSDDRRLGAHAWVECDGTPVNDTPAAVRAFAQVDLR